MIVIVRCGKKAVLLFAAIELLARADEVIE
jgi:hypothetical protein